MSEKSNFSLKIYQNRSLIVKKSWVFWLKYWVDSNTLSFLLKIALSFFAGLGFSCFEFFWNGQKISLIEALFKYNNKHYLVCEEMVIYENEVLDAYELYSHHEKKFRSIEINSLLDFYPLEGYTAANTTVVVLRHYPYYHPQDKS